jgi:HEAT repeat protein
LLLVSSLGAALARADEPTISGQQTNHSKAAPASGTAKAVPPDQQGPEKRQRPAAPPVPPLDADSDEPEPQAAPLGASKSSQGTSPTPIKRRRNFTEEDLRKQLAWAPEISLRPEELSVLVRRYVDNWGSTYAVGAGRVWEPTTLLSLRPDLARLPIQSGPNCQSSASAAATMTVLSRKLRAYMEQGAPKDTLSKRPDPVLLHQVMRFESRGKRPEWLRPEAVPVLLQLLMFEDRPLRKLLVDLLAEIDGKRASVALARRAVFDLAPDVRAAAVRALTDRPRIQYRDMLLYGFRYPWSPAADHAAEALVALQDRGAIPRLIQLLQKPEPADPQPQTTGRLVVREVVRVNHQANCLMCHPPAWGGRDPVPGIVPGMTLITATSTTGGYGGPGEGGGSSRTSRPKVSQTPLLVRADIVYLRQDFSVFQPMLVAAGQLPPADLRFDYLVRRRQATNQEISRVRSRPKGELSEQRQAVLFALRELTGQDLGASFDDWKALLPPPEAKDGPPDRVAAGPAGGDEAERLAQQLVQAPAGQRDELLTELRDHKGVVYTDALASAIPRLKGAVQASAREALASRMMRMTAATLRDKLQDSDLEIRRAAVRACPSKEDAALIPDLIPLLDDPEAAIRRLAHRALKTLSGQDFGPANEGGAHERTEAIAAWKSWWKKQGEEGKDIAEQDSP